MHVLVMRFEMDHLEYITNHSISKLIQNRYTLHICWRIYLFPIPILRPEPHKKINGDSFIAKYAIAESLEQKTASSYNYVTLLLDLYQLKYANKHKF